MNSCLLTSASGARSFEKYWRHLRSYAFHVTKYNGYEWAAVTLKRLLLHLLPCLLKKTLKKRWYGQPRRSFEWISILAALGHVYECTIVLYSILSWPLTFVKYSCRKSGELCERPRCGYIKKIFKRPMMKCCPVHRFLYPGLPFTVSKHHEKKCRSGTPCGGFWSPELWRGVGWDAQK